MKKATKKFLAMFMSAMMLTGFLPEAVFADDNVSGEKANDSVKEVTYEKIDELENQQKYVIIYDDETALGIEEDSIIGKSVEIEDGKIISEVTTDMIWTVDDENQLVSDNGKFLDNELRLVNEKSSTFNLNKNSISYGEDTVSYLDYYEGKWSLSTEINENITYYRVIDNQTVTEESYTEEEENYDESAMALEEEISTYKAETALSAVYFPVTMYNYDSSKIRSYTDKLSISSNQTRFQFVGGSLSRPEETINKNDNTHVTQGIVKNTLTAQNTIQFSDNIVGPDLFGNNSDSLMGKTVYSNVSFPFVYTESDGYYTFDSSKNHVHVDTSKTSEQTLSLYRGQQLNSSNQGSFFPFNSGESNIDADYHFGMNMGVGFYMTEDGLDENGNPIKFEFSGDDDVWVFIDGKLVLDLGGIHGVQGGAIDFQTGNVIYTGSGSTEILNSRRDTSGNLITTKATNLYDIINRDNLADGEEHTLQIFYLERGAGASNCKIKFNLPQKNKIEVTKNLTESTPITENRFNFQIQVKDQSTGEYIAYADKKYTLYTGQSNDGTGKTDSNGTFVLKAGQKAVFWDPEVGMEYRIVEVGSDTYTTKWTTKVNAVEQNSTQLTEGETGKQSPSIVINGTSKTNTYSFYCYNNTDISLVDDVVVLDYGKAVNIDVMSNDRAINNGITLTLDSVAKLGDTTFTDVDSANLQLTNGILTKSSTEGSDFKYTPTKYLDSIDKATYKVAYSVSDGDGNVKTGYKTANITVIPATSVYYEDNFGNTSDDNTGNGIVFSGSWETVTSGVNTSNTTQDNGTVESDGHPYGYDSSYENDNIYSGGSATIIKGDGKTVNASFTFKGTGFELMSRTDNYTGSIVVTISKKNENGEFVKVANKLVNNKYSNGILYQIPVVTYDNNEYGEYKVDIKVGRTTFYLDGIKINNPLGLSSNDNADYNEAYAQYKADKEANADVQEIRNMLIKANSFDITSSNSGVIFVDGNGEAGIDEYTTVGPNNEVYLSNGQKIAFNVPYNEELETVQVGMKAPNGETTVKVGQGNSTINIKTASDMYYDITANLVKSGDKYIVVIENTSDNILSITNLKMTYSNNQASSAKITSDEDTLNIVKSLTIAE